MKKNPGKAIGILILLMGLVGLISQLIKANDLSDLSYAKVILSLVIAGYGVLKIRSTSNDKN